LASTSPSERIAARIASARARCLGSLVERDTLRSPPRITRAPYGESKSGIRSATTRSTDETTGPSKTP